MNSMDPNLFIKKNIFIHSFIHSFYYLAVSGPSWGTWTL